MAQNKINLLEKKVPFNLSIRRGIKDRFELFCNETGISKNELSETLFKDFLNEVNRKDHDPTK